MGNLADLGLGDIFQIVAMSRRSGQLQLATATDTGEIVFKEGVVISAMRSGEARSVGTLLLDAELLDPARWQDVLKKQNEGMHAYEACLKAGLEREALDAALQGQLREFIYEMFEWVEGSFTFALDADVDRWEDFSLDGSLVVLQDGLSPQFLAMEGARIRDERAQADSLGAFLAQDESEPAESDSNEEIVFEEPEPSGQDAALPSETSANLAAPKTETPRYLLEEAQASVACMGAALSSRDAARMKKQNDAVGNTVLPFEGLLPASEAVFVPANGKATALEEGQAQSTLLVDDIGLGCFGFLPSERVDAHARVPYLHWTLLLVDDDALALSVLQEKLGPLFSRVRCASSSRHALDILAGMRVPPVLVSDMILPRSDRQGILGGVEILEEVRRKWKESPAVFFSDYKNRYGEEQLAALGSSYVLRKPKKVQFQSLLDAEKAMDVFASNMVDALKECLAHPDEHLKTPCRESLADDSMRDLGRELCLELSDGDLGFPKADDVQQDWDQADKNSASFDASTDLASLRSMIRELVDPANRDSVTLLVLRFASQLMERGALFLASRRMFLGLGGFSEQDDPEVFVRQVRRIQIRIEDATLLGQVLKQRVSIRQNLQDTPGNRRLLTALGGGRIGQECIAAPIISGDRVTAVLYGDNPSSHPIADMDGLDIFLQQAGLVMDRVLLERQLQKTRQEEEKEEK